MEQDKIEMEYRFLGPTGIKVSVISYGNSLNSRNCSEQQRQNYTSCVQTALDLGINFFDTSQNYGCGEGQKQLGRVLRELKVPRHKIVICTKFLFSQLKNTPTTIGLSRKKLIQSMKRSLENLGSPYFDIALCLRPDYATPMQQICRAFDWMIRKGWIFYWGTSQWESADIAQADSVCQKYNLIKPTVSSPQYNLFVRDRIQRDYKNLLQQKKLGVATFSPLLRGVLTGTYNDGVPQGISFEHYDCRYPFFVEQKKQKTLKALSEFKELSDQLGESMANLAMAWVIKNPDVSSAITGATKSSRLIDTMRALKIRQKIDQKVERRIQEIFKQSSYNSLDLTTLEPVKSRRYQAIGYS